MKFVRGFIYPALILSAAGYSATLTMQVESDTARSTSKRQREVSKQELLEEHLPLQISALQSIQGTFKAIMDAQRERDQIAAFGAACSWTSVQQVIADIQYVLNCLRAVGDQTKIGIGVGAAPAVQQEINKLIGYLDAAGVACDPLKGLAPGFQAITADIPNPPLLAQ